jgi:hypothetical protein
MDYQRCCVVRECAGLVQLSNVEVADMLDEIGRLLRLRGASPFRVAAYHRAARFVRTAGRPLAELFEREGIRGLRLLPGIGRSLSRKIGEMFRRGRSRSLERLRRQGAGDLLTTLPAVGAKLASRIRSTLGDGSLEEVFAAAQDGRLRRIEGLGRKRVQAIRESLAMRLDKPPPARLHAPSPHEPPVADLLAIDRDYRRQARAGTLLRVVPKRFNPAGVAWLPVLRTVRNGRHYGAQFANTANSHELGRTRDWVVIYCEDKRAFGRWTVVRSTHGPLRGKRVVRGRERECQQYYDQTSLVQLSLPAT